MGRSRRELHRNRHSPGTPPGTIVSPEGAMPPILRLMAYDQTELIDLTLKSPDDIKQYLNKYPVLWMDVDGFGDVGVLQKIAEIFSLHPLALEDVVGTHQRPKAEMFNDQLFVVAHKFAMENNLPHVEQISFFLGANFVLTFQERVGDCFAIVHDRLRRNVASKLRTAGPDYLVYQLLDMVVDSAFPVLEQLGDQLDGLEDALVAAPTRDLIEKIHELRRSLHGVRRLVWPLRDALSQMVEISDINLIKAQNHVFFRDCQDHTLQIIDVLETYRERASNLMDLYISTLSYRMNEVMKVLTVIATIFMPLTFIVGVYGMNFDPMKSPYNMPEIEWRYGYIYVWVLMVAITVGMIVYFRRKGWFD